MLKNYLTEETAAYWKTLVGKARNVIIVGHISPDGDAMGSTLALADCLRRQNKNVHVVIPNSFPDFLAWLPGISQVVNFERQHSLTKKLFLQADLVFCLDFNAPSRVEELGGILRGCRAPKIMIDHHLNPEDFADLLISDPASSSTCELLFCLLYQLYGMEAVSNEAAQCIYCGMMTDTGSFTYNSNRPEVFHIISLLLTKGIDKDKIYRAVYHNYSVNRLRLEGHILKDKMMYYPEEHTSVFTLTRQEMKDYQFKKGDAEGLVNLPLQIKGTRLSISLREDTEKDLIRVSLRSVDDFPCNRMAEDFFNGGGHLNAAGGSLPITMDEAVALAERAIQSYRDLLV